MPKAPFGDILRFLYRACASRETCGYTDRELLERFLSQGEESAFTFLVQRHGRMVFNVARQVLGNEHDAGDVFQAVFLVLARRSCTIGGTGSVGGWLHNASQRIALRARAQDVARRKRERKAAYMKSTRATDDLSSQELRSILHEEIGSLAEKYRTPIVLCYLEGQSYDQAAREIGCPKRTLENRLARGRQMLRRQLERRGIGLAVSALAASLTEMAVAAPLPALLATKTVKAAMFAAAGKSVAGILSAQALVLAEEALGILAVKGKLVLMALTLGLAVGSAGWAGYGGLTKQSQQDPLAKAQLPPSKAETGGPAKKDAPVAKDQYGDLLPEGAVARLGARRFRHDGFAMNDRALVFTRDGKSLIGYTHSGIIIWDAATGREQKRLAETLDPDVQPGCLDISPDGTTLVSCPDFCYTPDYPGPRLSLWRLTSGKRLRTPLFDSGGFDRVSFSPNGKSLVATCTIGGEACAFDLVSGIAKNNWGGRVFTYNHAISPDGTTVAAVVFPEGDRRPRHSVQLRDIVSGKLLRIIHDIPGNELRDEYQIRAITFAPNGKMLAFSSRNRIFLFDQETGKSLGQFDDKRDPITTIVFSPDSKKIVACGGWPHPISSTGDTTDSDKVSIWDVATGKVQQRLDAGAILNGSIAISPDGKTVALGVGTTVQLWDLATGAKRVAPYEGHINEINQLIYAPDDKTLISDGGERILFWNSATWQKSGGLPGKNYSPSLSPDGRQLAVVQRQENQSVVHIWNLAAAREALTIKARVLDQLEYSLDGRKLFTLEREWEDKTQCIRHWDLVTGKEDQKWTIPLYRDWCDFLAPDGRTVFRSTDERTTEIIDVASGRKRILPGADGASYYHPRFSPDGRMVAGAASNSNIGIWECFTGKRILTLKVRKSKMGYYRAGIPDLRVALAWSSDGRLFASGDGRPASSEPAETQSVCVWDTATGKELACFSGFKSDVSALTFSRAATSLAVGFRDGTILILDLNRTGVKLTFAPNFSVDELKSAWTDLLGDDAVMAHLAIGKLVIRPKQSVPFLRGRLKPVALADQSMIQRWIADLSSDKFAVRQAASKNLDTIGEQIQGPIHEALKGSPSLETSRRLEQTLKNFPNIPRPETLRTIRAIMALERVGSPEAQDVLKALARGAPGAHETEEAKASLERLKQRVFREP